MWGHVPPFSMESAPLVVYLFTCLLQVNEAGIQPSPRAARIFIYCNTVAQMLVFLSSCCNPVIYGIFNQNYRKSPSLQCCA